MSSPLSCETRLWLPRINLPIRFSIWCDKEMSIPVEKFQEDLKAQRLGQRADPRIDVSLMVQLKGEDLSGKAFTEMVKTNNVSRRGAQLGGVQAKLRVGDSLSITSDGKTEEFRVAWVGASLTPLANQIGVVATEQTTSLWDAVIENAVNQEEDASLRSQNVPEKK